MSKAQNKAEHAQNDPLLCQALNPETGSPVDIQVAVKWGPLVSKGQSDLPPSSIDEEQAAVVTLKGAQHQKSFQTVFKL